MGYGAEASETRAEWDERHDAPQSLGFWGATTRLPAAPVLTSATALIDELYGLPLQAFGSTRLADVPGLSGWSAQEQDAAVAVSTFQAGETARGAPRALVAGAIDAALESPDAAATIHFALYRSLTGEIRREPKAAPSAPPGRRGRLTGQEVAEALILEEILLDRR